MAYWGSSGMAGELVALAFCPGMGDNQRRREEKELLP